MSDTAPSMIDRPFAPPLARRVVIELPGEPRGKGRPRFIRSTGHAYTPQTTRNFEAQLKFAGQLAMKGAPPMEGALKVEILAAFSVPASWSKTKQTRAYAGTVRPTGKPDFDNIAKCVGDALNHVVWRDDSQIVTATVSKRYSVNPRLHIEVEVMFGEGA
jgi:Holliday junction resolvase RusA-like endonuclease